MRYSLAGIAPVLVLSLVSYNSSVDAQAPEEYLPDYHEGFEAGYPIGFEIGFDQGFDRGTTEGTDDGDTDGYDAGWQVAFQPAYDAAHEQAVPIGKLDGFADALPASVADGYEWAREIHEIVLSTGVTISAGGYFFGDLGGTLTIAIGDFGDGWRNSDLSFSGISGMGLTLSFSNLIATLDWSAHYFDEGYSDGYADGKLIGDEQGYDQAYPIAYEAAYDLAYPRGLGEGEQSGRILGHQDGYQYGFDRGWKDGDAVGFDVGVLLYQGGANLSDFNAVPFVTTYGNQLGPLARGTAPPLPVPEPSTTALLSVMTTMVFARRR